MSMKKTNDEQLLPFRDCLLCGSTISCFQIKINDRETWARNFCKLYNIDIDINSTLALSEQAYRLDVENIVRTAFYCTECYTELWSIAKLYKSIDDINAQLKVIQLQCESKLKKCLQSLKDAQEKDTESYAQEFENSKSKLNEKEKKRQREDHLKNFERKQLLLQCMGLKERSAALNLDMKSGLVLVDGSSFRSNSSAGSIASDIVLHDEEDDHEIQILFDEGLQAEDQHQIIVSKNDNEIHLQQNSNREGGDETQNSNSDYCNNEDINTTAEPDVNVKSDVATIEELDSLLDLISSHSPLETTETLEPNNDLQVEIAETEIEFNILESEDQPQIQDQIHIGGIPNPVNHDIRIDFGVDPEANVDASKSTNNAEIVEPYHDMKLKFNLKEFSIKVQRLVVTNSKCYPNTTLTPSSNSLHCRLSQNKNENRTRNKRQLRNQHKKPGFDCTYEGCDDTFFSEYTQVEHIRRVHEGLAFPFPCDICQKPCGSYNQMKDHENIHKGLNPHKCPDPTCPLRFATRLRLNRHIYRERLKQKRLNLTPVLQVKEKVIEDRQSRRHNRLSKLKLSPNVDIHVKPKLNPQTQTKSESGKEGKLDSESDPGSKSKSDPEQEWKPDSDEEEEENSESEWIHPRLRPFKCPPFRHIRTERKKPGRKKKIEISDSEFDFDSISIPKQKVVRNEFPVKFFCSDSSCKNEFATESLLREHISKFHKQELKYPYNCFECQKPRYTFKQWIEHGNVHRGLKPFKCPEKDCSWSFATFVHLRSHQRKRHCQPRFQCETCGKAFKVRCNLKLHSKIHEVAEDEGDQGEVPQNQRKKRKTDPLFRCEKCGRTYASVYAYKAHLITHDETKAATVYCKDCDKFFQTKQYLQLHIQALHMKEFRFRCTESNCDYGAMDKHILQRHLAIVHSDARPFVCDICQHTFKTKSYLNRHYKSVHPPTKDFVCDVCGKGFSNKRYLQEHEETHKDVKSFLCPLCGKEFTQRTRLNIHLRKVHPEDGGAKPGSLGKRRKEMGRSRKRNDNDQAKDS